jgi:hypothetical protein
MGRFNAALHPRDALGRFKPTYVAGSLAKESHVGRGGDFRGAKVGAIYQLPGGSRVLVKGIVGVAPPKKPRSKKQPPRPRQASKSRRVA